MFRRARFVEQLNGRRRAEVGIFPFAQRPDNFFLRRHFQHLHRAGPELWIVEVVRTPIANHSVAILQTARFLKNNKFIFRRVLLGKFPDDFALLVDFPNGVIIRR